MKKYQVFVIYSKKVHKHPDFKRNADRKIPKAGLDANRTKTNEM